VISPAPASVDDLGTVPGPGDLRRLDVAGCAELAGRIRSFLIDSVGRTGGHLGANLSTVELTIALHRAVRSPQTPIIWDTGHQSYTHKILTGRREGFASLRARHGMSGFPSRSESPHDLLENSHASVGPAWAYGVATALRRPAVVVIGDGALTGGVAFEGLNAIGHARAPVMVVVNDNGRSYDVTPSRLTYGEPIVAPPTGADPAAFFGALGFTCHGPVDGHDIAALDEALGTALAGPLPCVVHVRTQKGHGLPYALSDERKRLHDIAPNHFLPPEQDGPAAGGDWSSSVGDLLCELAADDDRIRAVTAAMADTVGLSRFRLLFPQRYHDLGIAEQACVAMAAGLASQGERPFFPVVATFLTRCLDQVLHDVALHRLPVIFLLDRAGVTGPDGPSHHGIFDVGLLRNVPGAEVYSPATTADVGQIVRDALRRDHGPLFIRYPKGRPAATVPAGTGLVRRGGDVSLLVHGSTVALAVAAAETLSARAGIECAIWRLNRIHPLDPALIEYASRTGPLIAVEEIAAPGGVAPVLAYEVMRRYGRAVPIDSLTLPSGFLPHGTRDELLSEAGFTPAGLAAYVRQMVSR
jgi:1-deoxy-D-xylulose-5-phosphate synthase